MSERRVLLQGSPVPRVVMARYFGGIGIVGGATLIAHELGWPPT